MEHIFAKLLQDFEQGKMTRRQLIQSLALVATAASTKAATAVADDSPVVKAINVNHISYEVADYARTRDFYTDLFGLKVAVENPKGKEVRLWIGDTLLVIRNRPADITTSRVDHFAFTIANWDTDKSVREEAAAKLKRRGFDRPPNS